MTIPREHFVDFQTALAAVQADPQASYLAVHLHRELRYLHLIEMKQYEDDEEPNSVLIAVEGGAIGDTGGEEQMFELSEVPHAITQLRFLSAEHLPDVSFGMVPEFTLSSIFPADLPDPEALENQAQQRAFAKKAAELIDQTWGSGPAELKF